MVVGLGKASWCSTGRVRMISRGVRTRMCWSGSGSVGEEEGGAGAGGSSDLRGGSGVKREERVGREGGEVCTPATFMVAGFGLRRGSPGEVLGEVVSEEDWTG